MPAAEEAPDRGRKADQVLVIYDLWRRERGSIARGRVCDEKERREVEK